MKTTKLFLSIFVLSILITPISAFALTAHASLAIFVGEPGKPNYEDYLTIDTQVSFNPPTQINQNTPVAVSILKTGQGGTPYVGQVNVQCTTGCSLGQYFFQSGNQIQVTYPFNTNLSVSNYGLHTVSMAVNEMPAFSGQVHHIEYNSGEAQFTVSSVTPQCSDSLNNDNAQGADTLDPECHTDCNVNNPGSYVPNHNSETTPPNGSCPVGPTLNLNGRSAFLDIARNIVAFFTTKAFAGE